MTRFPSIARKTRPEGGLPTVHSPRRSKVGSS